MSKAKLWIGLSAFAVVLILVGGWFALVEPKRADAADLRTQTESTEQQIVGLQARLRDLEEKKANLPAQTAELATISKKLPADPSLPPMIRALTGAARTAGVTLKSISPSTPAALPTVGKGAAPEISVIAVTLVTEGDYFATERLVSALEQLERGFLVKGFGLSGGGDSAGSDASAAGKLTLTVQGQVFVSTGSTTTGSATAGSAGSTSTGTAGSAGATAN
jgi:Tfp pilus assembly protein PilO